MTNIAPLGVSLLLVLGGAGTTLAVARALRGGPWVTRILFASYALRVTLAVALYLISAWHLPILPSLHLNDGFWLISRDAQAYHLVGTQVADSFSWGTELPSFKFFGEADFFFVIGFLYRVIGSHPLYVPLVNATLWTGILGLVYWLGRCFNGRAAGAMAVVFVAAWPSTYIWSGQVMKDTLVLFLLLAVLAALTTAFERSLTRGQAVALWTAVVPLAFLLVRLRFYIVPITIVALAGVVLLRIVWPTDRGRLQTIRLGGGIAVLLAAVFVLARGMDPIDVFSPAQPQAGHIRKGRYLQAHGDFAGARAEFDRAGVQAPHVDADARPAAETQVDADARPAAETQTGTGKAPPRPATSTNVETVRAITVSAQPRETRAPSRGFSAFLSVQRLSEQLQTLKLTPDRIRAFQRGFSSFGDGGALPETSATSTRRVSDGWDVVLQAPHAAAYALWGPFPWQWLAPEGDTGPFRRFAAIEVVLLIAVTPWLCVGVWRAFRGNQDGARLLIIYAAVGATLLGLTVTNIGIFFRLRLQFIVPLIVIAAAYGAVQTKLAMWLDPAARRSATVLPGQPRS